MFNQHLNFILISLLLLSFALPDNQFVVNSSSLSIGFGSCSKSYMRQRFWSVLEAKGVHLWAWLGDVVYTDTKKAFNEFTASPLEKVLSEYNAQKSNKGYKQFISGANDPSKPLQGVVGVWDDHDYGLNDGDRHFPSKDVNQQIFLDFIDEPQNSPRRTRKGLYSSYDITSTFLNRTFKTKLILLDNRYFRDTHSPSDPSRSILGAQQWDWLETELSNSNADVHIIGGGIQIIPDDKNQFAQLLSLGKHSVESWGLFPFERARLFDTLSKLNISHTVLLSGDVHFAEISVLDCSVIGYPLYEFTSSGITHTWMRGLANQLSGISFYPLEREDREPSDFSMWIARCICNLLFYLVPSRFTESSYFDLNVGVVSVDWELELIRIEFIGPFSDVPVLSKEIPLKLLERDGKTCHPLKRIKSELKSVQLSWIPMLFRIVTVLSPVIVLAYMSYRWIGKRKVKTD